MRRAAGMCGLLAATALFTASIASAQVSIGVGIQIGPPPPPRVVKVVPPPPAAAYVWIPGYWYPVGNHYKWHEGYYTVAPYPGAVWVEPHHDGHMYYVGYWEGEHGKFAHDHHWDHDHDRDAHRYEHR